MENDAFMVMGHVVVITMAYETLTDEDGTPETCICGSEIRVQSKKEPGFRKWWMDCENEDCEFGRCLNDSGGLSDDDERTLLEAARDEWNKYRFLESENDEIIAIKETDGNSGQVLYRPEKEEEKQYLYYEMTDTIDQYTRTYLGSWKTCRGTRGLDWINHLKEGAEKRFRLVGRFEQ